MHKRQAGFTLMELLVALIISGIFATILFQLLQGQGRFVQVQSGREEVQQNARAVLELVGSEIRSIPPGGGLQVAAANAIEMQVPRFWGVVCAVSATNPVSWIDLRVPQNVVLRTGRNNSTGLMVNLGTDQTPVWSPPLPLTAELSAGGCPPLSAADESWRVEYTPGATPPVPEVGDLAYVYDVVAYDMATSAGETWIRRSEGDSGFQPMAGPVDPSNGLLFRFFRGNNAVPETSLPMNANQRADVSRIEVNVHAISLRTGSADVEEESSMLVYLRNRITSLEP